jgi:hypothetical protein
MPPYSLRRLLWAGPVATVAAALAGMLYFGVTRALGEQYLMPLGAGGSIPAPMPVSLPVAAILVPGLLATILFGLLIRFTRRPATIFLSVCVAAMVLSLGGPFNLPGSSLQTKLLLSGMHGIAASFISGGILLLSHSDLK